MITRTGISDLSVTLVGTRVAEPPRPRLYRWGFGVQRAARRPGAGTACIANQPLGGREQFRAGQLGGAQRPLPLHPHCRRGRALGRAATSLLAQPATRYVTNAQQADFYDQLIERLEAQPQVKRAAMVVGLPLSGIQPRFAYAHGNRSSRSCCGARSARLRFLRSDIGNVLGRKTASVQFGTAHIRTRL